MLSFVHISAILELFAAYICYFRTGVSEQAVGTLKMGPKCCRETSVRSYHFRLRKISKESRSRSHRGGIPKINQNSAGFVSFHLHAARKFQRIVQNYSKLSGRKEVFFFCFFLQNIRSFPLGSGVCDTSGQCW